MECPTLGSCDVAVVRDLYAPEVRATTLVLRAKVHVFQHDDDSDPLDTVDAIMGQLMTLEGIFAAVDIELIANFAYISDSSYRDYSGSQVDEHAMKTQYATLPHRQLNIFVVDTPGSYAVATFPWEDHALTPLGGIVIDHQLFGPGKTLLAHEIGHTLGLWHTHHGVDEVEACGPCYEFVHSSYGNTTGDLCDDTPPTPLNYACTEPQSLDCAGDVFGPTATNNYMSYAPSHCHDAFTAQQSARMHCWARAGVHGWIVDCNRNGQDDADDLSSAVSLDCNDNGFPDDCELDCDGNGIPDVCQNDDDCDGNGNLDSCDADLDGDGLIDGCDADADGDGIDNAVDDCPNHAGIAPHGAPWVDIDADCDVDGIDYVGFWSCYLGGGPAVMAQRGCGLLFDHQGDQRVDLADYAELQRTFTAE
jgi:hypothetical protein